MNGFVTLNTLKFTYNCTFVILTLSNNCYLNKSLPIIF